MAELVDIGSAINYQYTDLIDATPNAAEPTWVWMGPGIASITPSRDEKKDENDDYSTGGNTVTTVKGVAKTMEIEGTRIIGDPFQEFLASLEEVFGDERKTTYRCVSPTGEIIEEDVTVMDILVSGPNGAASDKQAISCSLARNDVPRLIQEAKGHHLPATVKADSVTVQVGQKQQVTPTVTPDTASDWCTYAVKDNDIARVTADGKVEGLKAGKTTLVIKCAPKPSVSVAVEVEVTAE